MTRYSGRKAPETTFGARLRAARKMAGMSMEDLAAKLGGLVTKQAISKYEQGQMMPSPEVLEKLVEVLKTATWGASPLRLSDRDQNEALAIESQDLFRFENQERSMFRRTRITDRRNLQTEIRICKKNLPRALADRLEFGSNPAQETEIDRAERSGQERQVEIPCERIRRGEGFPTLATRRARLVRAWESGAAIDEIRFRSGERLTSKTKSALKYRIADHLQKYSELESILGMPAVFENPIAGRPARKGVEIEGAAAEARMRWELGSGPIVNLLGLLEDRGIKVYEARGIDGFEGLSGRFGEVPFVAVSMEYPADRIRLTAAHELGHVLCDFDAVESPEGECHAFGAAFLLPRATLEKVFMPSRRKVTLGDLAEIKETYGISLQAIMYRAHALELAGDRQIRSFREIIKAKGWVLKEPVAYTGKERATRFRRLLHYAVAADILDVNRAAEMVGVLSGELEDEIGDIF